MPKTRICKHCAKPITGRYLTALDANWHPDHFCCVICQKPITDSQFYIHNGQPCHPECYTKNIAPRCTICADPLTGSHHVNYWGDRFCTHHSKELAGCAYCGRLVPHATKRTRRRSIEDISCDICASTAIDSLVQGRLLFDGLIDWVERQGLRFRQKSFRLEILDRADFLEREGGRRDPLGLTSSKRYMRNKRVESVELTGVAILRGLPHPLFEGVCVHELGHVWLLQQNILHLPQMEEEGFCELISHRHYVEIGSKPDLFYAERIAKNNSPVYGDGFRKLKRLEERVGLEQIIKSLLRKKKLPL